MTEQEWLEVDDGPRLACHLFPALVTGERSLMTRKTRLLLVACCHRAWHLLSGVSKVATSIASRAAEGDASKEEHMQGIHLAEGAVYCADFAQDHWKGTRYHADYDVTLADYERRITEWGYAVDEEDRHRNLEAGLTATRVEVANLALCASYMGISTIRGLKPILLSAGLIRDVFGNPFRPVAPDPSWVPSNAVVLAQTMYDTRDFTLMPLLADLLEEAGCPAEVAQHCRGPGPHIRGCWVVDLVLGKE